jgi:hypothetical protein
VNVDVFIDLDDIPLADLRNQRFHAVNAKLLVELVPRIVLLQVRVHPGKR